VLTELRRQEIKSNKADDIDDVDALGETGIRLVKGLTLASRANESEREREVGEESFTHSRYPSIRRQKFLTSKSHGESDQFSSPRLFHCQKKTPTCLLLAANDNLNSRRDESCEVK